MLAASHRIALEHVGKLAQDPPLRLHFRAAKRALRWPAVGNLRHGIMVSLEDGKGRMTSGGAWPLPPLSLECVKDVHRQLKALPRQAKPLEWLHISLHHRTLPSLRWALSAALWRMVYRAQPVCRQSAVLVELPAPRTYHHRRRVRCLKLKLKGAVASPNTAYSWLKTLPKDTLLRLDAQGHWHPDAVLELHQRLLADGFKIDYWEDPCPVEQLARLDTIADKLASDVVDYKQLSHCGQEPNLVVKATLCGSVWEFLHLLQKRADSTRTIVSSTGEGLETCQLLAELSPRREIHGFWPMTL